MTAAVAASRAFADFGAAGAASIAGTAAGCAAGTGALDASAVVLIVVVGCFCVYTDVYKRQTSFSAKQRMLLSNEAPS